MCVCVFERVGLYKNTFFSVKVTYTLFNGIDFKYYYYYFKICT